MMPKHLPVKIEKGYLLLADHDKPIHLSMIASIENMPNPFAKQGDWANDQTDITRINLKFGQGVIKSECLFKDVKYAINHY